MKFWPAAWMVFSIASSAFAVTDLPTSIMQQRDPFKRPNLKESDEGPRSELTMYPIERFKMLGVMTGGEHLKAMVSAPNNKTYFVEERMTIGDRKGVIRKITDKSILIREKIVNVLGQEETVDSSIDLPMDAKVDVKQVTSEKGW